VFLNPSPSSSRESARQQKKEEGKVLGDVPQGTCIKKADQRFQRRVKGVLSHLLGGGVVLGLQGEKQKEEKER
jgi:hypothetical protein